MKRLLVSLIMSGILFTFASCTDAPTTEGIQTTEPVEEQAAEVQENVPKDEVIEEKMIEKEIVTYSIGDGAKTLSTSDFPEAKAIDSVDGKALNEFETAEKTADVFFETGAAIRSAVAIHEGILYFGNESCEFFAVDISTKQQLWSYRTDDSVQTLPVFSEGMVIFNAGNSLYGLNQQNGDELFKVTHATESKKRLSNESYTYNDTGTAVSGSVAYYGALNGDIVAVDIAGGEILYVFSAVHEGTLGSGVNFNEDYLYWVNHRGVLCCADVNTREMIFMFNLNDRVYAPMLIQDGKIYIAGRSCKIYCIDAKTGDLVWSSFADDETTWFSGGSVCVGDVVYTGTSDRHALFSYDKNTGEFSRLYSTETNVYAAPLLNGSNIIVAATDVYSFRKSYIMEFDTENHVKLWQAHLEDGVLSSPAMYDGAVYFGSDSGNVYSIDLK